MNGLEIIKLKIKAFLMALLLAAPAAAEFSAQEKAQVKAQIDSMAAYDRAIHWVIQHCNAKPADANACGSFIDAAAEARRQHHLGLLWLLDMNGAEDKQTGRAILASETRAQIIARGVAGILDESWYSAAESTLNGLTGTNEIVTAKSLFTQGQAGRRALNTALAYVEPRLAVNLAIPGATRDKSDTAGPHGDYRRAGELLAAWGYGTRSSWQALAATIRTGQPGITTAAFQSGHSILSARAAIYGLGLLVGVEVDEYKPHVDSMFAGGTTARGREFFQVLLFQESFLNWTHTDYPHYLDVNGRIMLRGTTYDLEAACSAAANMIKADAASTLAVKAQADYIRSLCLEWGRMDDAVYQGTSALKNFQVFPAPGPNTCDPATTVWNPTLHLCVGTGGGPCPVGESCQPPCPPEITCGTGTHLEGTVCVADPPPPCPQYTPVLDYLADRIQPRCVVQ